MPSENALQLERGRAVLLVVDVQERLAAAMPPEDRARVEKNAGVLVQAARRLGVPVIASEQYPRGLGPTVAGLRARLPEPPLEKLEFSCARNPQLLGALRGSGRRQAIVAGMETHVCVFQTVRDLVREGFEVFVPRDAVVSRTAENREVGLQLCEKAGATITSSETVVFDLLGVAGTPEFKELSALIK